MQRAFKIAGAKYLIMSLWQVPDKQTSLLMTTFYKKWLENKMSIQMHSMQQKIARYRIRSLSMGGICFGRVNNFDI